MKKTLYSLMLNDEVVREVDILAHRLGTNRSALINQILAEYVDYTTPERRINDVLSAIEQLMAPSRELVPFFAPNTFSMSLKVHWNINTGLLSSTKWSFTEAPANP